MTVTEFIGLFKRRLVHIAVFALVFAIAGSGFGFVTAGGEVTASATSRIIANSQISGIAGLAQGEVRAIQAEGGGLDIKVDSGSVSNTVTITVTGGSPEVCVSAANRIAHAAESGAEAFYAGYEDIQQIPYRAYVEEASIEQVESEGEDSFKKMLKFGIAGACIGLFLGVCYTLAMDAIKRPVRGATHIADATGFPVLDVLPTKDGGEKLYANVCFVVGIEGIKSVCILPVSEMDSGMKVATELNNAIGSVGITKLDLTLCNPLSEGVNAAFTARKADTTVVVVKQWVDTIPNLLNALSELKLAKAMVAGVVLVK